MANPYKGKSQQQKAHDRYREGGRIRQPSQLHTPGPNVYYGETDSLDFPPPKKQAPVASPEPDAISSPQDDISSKRKGK